MNKQQVPTSFAHPEYLDKESSLDAAAQSIPFLVFDVHDADCWESLDMPTILVAQQVLVALSEREEILAELDLDPYDVKVALQQISAMRARSEKNLASVA